MPQNCVQSHYYSRLGRIKKKEKLKRKSGPLFLFFSYLKPIKIIYIVKWDKQDLSKLHAIILPPWSKRKYLELYLNIQLLEDFRKPLLYVSGFQRKTELGSFQGCFKTIGMFPTLAINANLRQEVLRKF